MTDKLASPSQTFAIPIAGMSCASCVGRVEKAIRGVEGVQDVAVNLATERAQVSAAPGTRPEPVLDAIRKAGYEPQEESADLTIRGMSCASCVGRVERALNAVPGVLGASVNLATERAQVRYAGGADVLASVMAAAEKAGYPAEPVRTDAARDDREKASPRGGDDPPEALPDRGRRRDPAAARVRDGLPPVRRPPPLPFEQHW
jgi:Cu+-exporting ATPase